MYAIRSYYVLQTEQAAVTPLLDAQQLLLMQHQVSQVHAADAVLDYLLALGQESRRNDLSPNALSPRASRALLAAARAWAYMAGRDYLLPDDIQAIFAPVAEHRLRTNQGRHSGQRYSFSRALLERVDPVR